MATLARIILPLLIPAVALMTAYWMIAQKEPPVRASEASGLTLVETVTVADHDGGLTLGVDGVVVPYRLVEVSAEVSGRIQSQESICQAGNFVTKGTPLLQIDPREYELEVRRLNEELRQAIANFHEADVEIENTQELLKLAEEDLDLERKQLSRLTDLSKKNYAADADLDQARRNELAARNAIMSQENQLRLWQTRRTRLESARDLVSVQLERAQLDLDRTTISAPIEGVIVQESVEQESYVQKGTPLLVLDDTSRVEVVCHLRADELSWLWEQAGPASVSAPAMDPAQAYRIPETPVTIAYSMDGVTFTWDGILSRYEGIGVDEATRTVPCRVVVNNPRERQVRVSGSEGKRNGGPPALVRGMFVTVELHVNPQSRLLELPERAVRPGNVVWILRDGKLRIQEIEVARILDDTVLIRARDSELAGGDRVVTSPLASAENGMPVEERLVQ